MSEKKSTLTFETALAQLEQTVKDLESKELTLDEALETFEKGIALVKKCRQDLDHAEQRVSVLLKNEKGEVDGTLEAFDSKDAEEK